MPDKSSTVISYAAGASLAAVALIYVFGPNFTIDHEASSKKKTIIGLRNQANDCFINSVLQVLAGLGDLRVYLIRETHRRRIEDAAVYANLVQPEGTARLEQWKLQGLQDGLVTQGLKDMLDALNERPIYKKSVSPFPFVKVLEVAFKQRISRQQQDAQEFLQIVAERLKDEYHAGQRARFHARKNGLLHAAANGTESPVDGGARDPNEQDATDGSGASGAGGNGDNGDEGDEGDEIDAPGTPSPSIQEASHFQAQPQVPLELEEGFPMEGKYESHLECQTCRYKTKPREETFCTLTLAVPQVASTSLNSCFDGVFKTEYIDDFKCEMCRLMHVKANLEHEISLSNTESFIAQARDSIRKLQAAIDTDPEQPPEGVDLGDIRYAPKRRIAKTTRISIFPKILAIHLSRSIYGIGQMTQKNSAKVAFPEELPLGGLADQHKYKLLGTVTHRGGHNSGHYEAFRRQNQPSPYHNTNTFQQSDVYSRTPTPMSTPEIRARPSPSPAISTPDLLSPSPATNSSTPSLVSMAAPPRSVPAEQPGSASPASSSTSTGRERDADTTSLRSVAASTKSALSRLASTKGHEPRKLPSNGVSRRPRRRKAPADKWWRVSDEKVHEAKTTEVLGMQREVYLLFYELER
ncbi:Ubiquitin carboxyl-terminal hydrolase 16 [Metarhizium rileyi]|uniref:Ubiquitin carboxyl-terminal hydrolase n=1 Tax=Metarhizium rileyi (strain RCEF 4871) TaxID=1649241 RepID=A0A162HSG7_METRR|nr:Ubiquitin carboxyl-terminal hydrolase 16 [Metarhizium rileyi RCEF 4871]